MQTSPHRETPPRATFGKSTVLYEDGFETDTPPGTVLNNQHRLGIDLEKALSIDNGALRIAQLANPGWRRASLAYGPFQRTTGKAFLVHMLNGHNTSQSGDLSEKLMWHLISWMRGANTAARTRQFLLERLKPGNLLGQLTNPLLLRKLKRIRYWAGYNRRNRDRHINENLAIGWFEEATPIAPPEQGSSLVMHALGPRNGQLWICSGEGTQVLLSDIQNIPIFYLSVLREQGSIFYASSLDGAHGLPTYPAFRPLGMESANEARVLYPGIHQSVMGQKGFTVDSRVRHNAIFELEEARNWYTTACYANALTDTPDANHPAAARFPLDVVDGDILFSPQGAGAGADGLTFWVYPDQPAGLISICFTGTSDCAFALRWRGDKNRDFMEFGLEPERITLRETHGEREEVDAVTIRNSWKIHRNNRLTISDNGEWISISLNGSGIFKEAKRSLNFSGNRGVGLQVPGGQQLTFHHLEIHPRELILEHPSPAPPAQLKADPEPLLADDFSGNPGELAGRQPKSGEGLWQRTLGTGSMLVENDGLRVQASLEKPNPGRTAYTLPWESSRGAELSATLIPPGNKRGEGQMARGGFIFWQDEENYIVVNNWNDDNYPGASISSFFFLNGEEDIFDAVWSNVGSRILWGEPHCLRGAFDGDLYQIWINDEPVLYRRLSDVYPRHKPLIINRVGLVANWEFGNDTGTVFRDFSARELVK